MGNPLFTKEKNRKMSFSQSPNFHLICQSDLELYECMGGTEDMKGWCEFQSSSGCK